MMLRVLACLLLFFCSLPVSAQAPPAGVGQSPSSQSELSQQGVSLKTVVVGPQKGLLSNVAESLRTEEYAKVLDNLHMIKRGVWTSRGTGISKHRASNFNSGGAFLTIAPHYVTATSTELLFQSGDKIYEYNINTQTETSRYSGLSTSKIGDIRSFSPTYVSYVNGDINPLKWTGSGSFSSASGWPVTIATINYEKPKYQENFASRLCFAGFVDRPSDVVFSYAGYPESFTTGGAAGAGVISMPAALGPVTGIRALRIDSTTNESVLLIGCSNGFGLVSGRDGTNFVAVEYTREFGLISNRTWMQLGNDLYFLATDGVRRFSTNQGIATLSTASLTFANYDVFNRINRAQAEKAFVVPNPTTQEVIWWFPIDSGTDSDHAIVMNYNSAELDDTAPSSVVTPIFSTNSGVAVSCGCYTNNTLFYGTSDGYLKVGYSGDTWDGTAISWEYMPAFVGANSPLQSASAREFVVITEGANQKFGIAAYTLSQRMDDVTVWNQRATKSVNITSPTITKVGTWASGTTTSYPKYIAFSPPGSGRYWALRLTGTTSSDQIDLVGVLCVLTIGGWKQ